MSRFPRFSLLMISRITIIINQLKRFNSYKVMKTIRTKPFSDFEIQQQIPIVKKMQPIPPAKYGGRYVVTMLPGGGIGPEAMQSVKDIFLFLGVPVDFEELHMDPLKDDNVDLDIALTSIRRNGVCIKGAPETLSLDPDVRLRNVSIRNDLELFAYVICCRSYPNVRCRHKDVNIVVIRQNIGGSYAMLEHSCGRANHDVVECLQVTSAELVRQLAHYSFQYARKNKRKKITVVHKANIMKLADGVFLSECLEVAKEYPDIEANEMIVDNTTMQLVSKPQQFDVLLCLNLYGNVIANVICGLCGGPGLFSGKNYGNHYAVFEPGTRNRGTELGSNVANPICMINASVEMLFHLGLDKHATIIADAVYKTLVEDKIHTKDLGGTNSTSDVVDKILQNIAITLRKIADDQVPI